MINQQLIDYIKQHLAGGNARVSIEEQLLKAGWKQEDINAGFAAAESGAPLPPTMPMAAAKMTRPSQLLKQAWDIYKNRFWTFIKITIIPVIVIGLGFMLLFSGWAVTGIFKNELGPSGFAITSIAAAVLSLILLIAAIYLYIWAQTALLFAIKDTPEKIGLKEAYKRARPKINTYFFACFLSGLAVLGGLILFIIPGIIFGVWYSLSGYVVISEDVKAVEAVKKSREYVRGFWWAVFGRFAFIIFIYFVIYIAVSIAVGIILAVAGINTTETQNAVGQSIQQLLSVLLTPLITIYSYQIYNNLKQIKG